MWMSDMQNNGQNKRDLNRKTIIYKKKIHRKVNIE